MTPAKINLSVRNTKYPPASAAAMGNPTSAMILKISMIFLLTLLYVLFIIIKI
jgi:hypothetical protein